MSKHHAHGETKGGTAPAGEENPAERAEETAGQGPAAEAVPADAGQADTEPDSPADAPAAEEIIADLEAQLADAKDQYLRKAADFENFRKRMIREKQDAIDFANQALLLDLIPIIDDFERA
ncbi:MAG: nucleotide exchange factor GrpE, partial [Treponema sp.]|nr:nucleotide exchange factor GrpE [Treponema sp.]